MSEETLGKPRGWGRFVSRTVLIAEGRYELVPILPQDLRSEGLSEREIDHAFGGPYDRKDQS
ncbi:MAG: hypothetical protein M3456_00540 [Actinomycetota bacterium]|nr:hypothetical protein [Actinomycetota bacterium]